MDKLQQAVDLVEQVSELTHTPMAGELLELKSEVQEAVQDGKQHKLKDMAHKIIDILAKVIPMVKSLVGRRKKQEVATRGFSTLSNRSAIMLSLLVKVLSVYSSAKSAIGLRSIADECSVVEEAMAEHVFERDLDDSHLSLEDAAELMAEVLGSDSVEDIYEVLVEFKSGLCVEDDQE